MDSALPTLECALPDSTWTGPRAAVPCSAMETPRCSPSHSRAMARPAKLDMVAPLTKAPWSAVGSPSSSRSQAIVSRSRSGAVESRPEVGFWSRTPVSQSPASAAGVQPPVTKPR
jgi:hypothetical protein